MNAIKKFFQDVFKDKKVKKEKAEPRELPKGKKSNGRGARIFVWSIVAIVCITGILGFIRSTNALNKLDRANAQIAENKQNNISLSNQEAYEKKEFQIYAGDVASHYMNIPKGDEERESYMDHLKDYVVSKEFLPDIDFDGYRDLKNKSYYGKEQQEDHVVAQYKVSYETVNKDKEETKEHEAMLNIPIRADDHGEYVVVESMYFSPIPDLKGDHQKPVSDPYEEDHEEEIDVNKRNDLQHWVEDFFESYASETEEDMAYMMDTPEALDGLQEFQGIRDFHVYQEDDRYIAKVKVTYREPGADIKHEESYTMKLKTMNDKYYVEDLDQTLGGK